MIRIIIPILQMGKLKFREGPPVGFSLNLLRSVEEVLGVRK